MVPLVILNSEFRVLRVLILCSDAKISYVEIPVSYGALTIYQLRTYC